MAGVICASFYLMLLLASILIDWLTRKNTLKRQIFLQCFHLLEVHHISVRCAGKGSSHSCTVPLFTPTPDVLWWSGVARQRFWDATREIMQPMFSDRIYNKTSFCWYTLTAITAPPKIIRNNRSPSKSTWGKLANAVFRWEYPPLLGLYYVHLLSFQNAPECLKSKNNLKAKVPNCCRNLTTYLHIKYPSYLSHPQEGTAIHCVSAIRHNFQSCTSMSDNFFFYHFCLSVNILGLCLSAVILSFLHCVQACMEDHWSHSCFRLTYIPKKIRQPKIQSLTFWDTSEQ